MQNENQDSRSRRCRSPIESRIVAVRTSNSAPAQIEVETDCGTRDLTVPTESNELLALLIQCACGGKRIRVAVNDNAHIEAVEVVN
jgi:hypothetical protein